jgi:2-haloacid dehalogenase
MTAPSVGGGRERTWVLFDLNGTLLDPGTMAQPLGGSDEDRGLLNEAFRDALLLTMADTLSGGPYKPLPEYLRATLERTLRAQGRALEPLDAAIELAGAMDPFPEAEDAISLLTEAGLHVGVLTNSATESGTAALEAAGLRDRLEIVIGSDEVQVFKPHPRVYLHAAGRVGTDPGRIVLVAAHAWDVAGAIRAGMQGAWVARGERWLVPIVPQPQIVGQDLEDVARQLTG